MNKIVFLLCLISPALSWSHQPEEGKIFGTFGPHIYQSHLMQTEASVDNPIEKGFGLIAEGDLDHNGGLEIGMFYLNKQYVRQRSDQLLIERAKRMYITMGYRHWFNPSYSFAGAIFSSYSMGDPKPIRNDFGPNSEMDTSARDSVEYGLDLSFQWEYWRQKDMALLVDLRYSASFTSKENEDSDHYLLLFGVKHRIQEK